MQICAWLIAVALQVFLQVEQMIGQLMLETGCTGHGAFAPRRFAVG